MFVLQFNINPFSLLFRLSRKGLKKYLKMGLKEGWLTYEEYCKILSLHKGPEPYLNLFEVNCHIEHTYAKKYRQILYWV